MEIPALFARSSPGIGLEALSFDGALPDPGAAGVPFREAASRIPRSDGRAPAVVVDWDSLRRGRFVKDVVKGMRVRGSDVWFLTWVEDAGDLMDAFNTVADRVLVPVHSVASDADMTDICAMSDGAVPTVFVRNGLARARERTCSVCDALEGLEGIGFDSFCVLDADSSIASDGWRGLADRFPSCVPFVGDASRALCFDRVATPLRLRPSPR